MDFNIWLTSEIIEDICDSAFAFITIIIEFYNLQFSQQICLN